jgi:hypothetical protein
MELAPPPLLDAPVLPAALLPDVAALEDTTSTLLLWGAPLLEPPLEVGVPAEEDTPAEDPPPDDGAAELAVPDDDTTPPLLLEDVPPPMQPAWHNPKSTPMSAPASKPLGAQQPCPLGQSPSRVHTTAGSRNPPMPTHASGALHAAVNVLAQHTSPLRQSSGPSHAKDNPNPLHDGFSHMGSPPPRPTQHRSMRVWSHVLLPHRMPGSSWPTYGVNAPASKSPKPPSGIMNPLPPLVPMEDARRLLLLAREEAPPEAPPDAELPEPPVLEDAMLPEDPELLVPPPLDDEELSSGVLVHATAITPPTHTTTTPRTRAFIMSFSRTITHRGAV